MVLRIKINPSYKVWDMGKQSTKKGFETSVLTLTLKRCFKKQIFPGPAFNFQLYCLAAENITIDRGFRSE